MANKKIGTEWNNYGGLRVTGNSTAETTTDATPRKIAAFDTALPASPLATVSAVNKSVTVTDAGDYLFLAQLSFSGTLSKTFVVEAYIDTTASNLQCTRKLGTGGDIGSASLCGILTLAAGEAVSLYHSSTDGGTAFTAVDAQFAINRLR